MKTKQKSILLFHAGRCKWLQVHRGQAVSTQEPNADRQSPGRVHRWSPRHPAVERVSRGWDWPLRRRETQMVHVSMALCRVLHVQGHQWSNSPKVSGSRFHIKVIEIWSSVRTWHCKSPLKMLQQIFVGIMNGKRQCLGGWYTGLPFILPNEWSLCSKRLKCDIHVPCVFILL